MYPTDAATDAAIAAGRVNSAYLLDLYCRTSEGAALTLRWWDQPGVGSYPGTTDLDGSTSPNSYASVYGRIVVNMVIRQAATLASEPLEIHLDASRSTDDEDEIGKFVDANWHQMQIRIRQVARNWDTDAFHALPLREWRGLLDHRELVEPATPEEPRIWNVTCQGGLFRVRGRRLSTRSHADQQRRSAGDMFYVGTANMVGRPLSWAKSPGNIPGSSTGGGSTASGGTVNGGPANKGREYPSLW